MINGADNFFYCSFHFVPQRYEPPQLTTEELLNDAKPPKRSQIEIEKETRSYGGSDLDGALESKVQKDIESNWLQANSREQKLCRLGN